MVPIPGSKSAISFHHHGQIFGMLPADGLRPVAWRWLQNQVYQQLETDSGRLARGLAAHKAFSCMNQAWSDALRNFESHVLVDSLDPVRRIDSANGETTRLLFQTRAGLPVETVIMRHPKNPAGNPLKANEPGTGRCTVCLSSQSGCALGCLFCATGALGGGTDLDTGEIISQAIAAERILRAEGQGLRNAVFMGMGEPLLNWESVKEAALVLGKREGFHMAWRRITISTAGISPGISRLAEELPGIGLAVSLHAPNDQLRAQLMPIARRWNLDSLMAALKEFESASAQEVWFEYLMIQGLNDSPDQARELAAILSDHKAKVNLIPWNPVPIPGAETFKPSLPGVQNEFKTILKAAGIPTTIRHTMGDDIAAACGQLARQGQDPRK